MTDDEELGEMATRIAVDKLTKSGKPNKIAQDLLDKYGVNKAVGFAMGGVANAITTNDNYSLSIWREVRRLLREKQNC
jgi:hypothetical protein